jgi:predicted amino acid dehydrogenase
MSREQVAATAGLEVAQADAAVVGADGNQRS